MNGREFLDSIALPVPVPACGLGRHLWATHDLVSRRFPAETAPLRSVEWARHGPVLDQGSLGSCTGNAMAQALNCAPLVQGRRLLTELDAVELYSWATCHDSFPGFYPPTDTGSDGLSVAKAAKSRGMIGSYRHAFGVRHALGALPLGPLVMGVTWYEGMFNPTSEGLLEPTGSVVGGHEVAVVGMDVEREQVTILNSWGDSWGDRGKARMSWSVLGRLLADGGDIVVPIRQGAQV